MHAATLPGFAAPGRPGASGLHSVVLGEGEHEVVFLHGLGGTARYWTCGPVAPVFPGCRTRLLDLYGFGDSPRPWCRYTVARHLDALQRTLGDGPPLTLVGHSMGAALALIYAARFPARVRALCLLALPHYGNPHNARAWFAQQRGGWLYTSMFATALACIVTRRVAGRWLPHLVRDVPAEVARDLVKHNALSSTTSLWDVLYRHDLGGDAAMLPADLAVRCVHGRRDTTAPYTAAARLAHAHRWQWVALDDADHHPWLRRPQRCHAAIRELLPVTRPEPAAA